MTADNLQKYVADLNTKLRKMKKPNKVENIGYNEAIEDLSEVLTKERNEIINSYKSLKDRGLV